MFRRGISMRPIVTGVAANTSLGTQIEAGA